MNKKIVVREVYKNNKLVGFLVKNISNEWVMSNSDLDLTDAIFSSPLILN